MNADATPDPTSQTPADPSCIFCKIVRGDIPCYKLYEDEQVLSFLDVGPLAQGHCLIIPKAHYATIDILPKALASACIAVAPALSRAVVAATGAKGWNLLQNNGSIAGQAVHHVHFHILPRAEGDQLGFRWPAGTLDADEAGKLIDAITSGMD